MLQQSPMADAEPPGGFSVDVRPDRSRVVVAPYGELDLATRDELTAEVRRLADAGFGEIVLDLCHLKFIDSSGLVAVIQMHEDAQRDGHRLTILKGSPNVQRCFELCGLVELLPFSSPPTPG